VEKSLRPRSDIVMDFGVEVWFGLGLLVGGRVVVEFDISK